MPRTFTFKHVARQLPTAEESRANGYATGLEWKETYRPGGPYVSRDDHFRNDEGWRAYCEASAENNRAWLEGFDEGREKRRAESNALSPPRAP